MSHSLSLRFISIFGSIALVLCGLTYWFLKRRLGLTQKENRVLLWFFVGTGLLMMFAPGYYRTHPMDVSHPASELLQFLQYFLMGWVVITFLLFTILEIAQLISKPFDPQKRIFLTEGVARGALAVATTATVGGLIEAAAGPKIERVTINLPTLPPSFDGLTLAQISDVHIGPILHGSFLNQVVDKVMSLNADIILITGDLVDGSVSQLVSHVEALKRLKAKHGIYFCTGNHEYYSGAEAWIEHLEQLGIHVFKNDNIILTRNGSEHLLIGGVYDYQAERFSEDHRTDPFKAAKTDLQVSCKILLAHNPMSITQAAEAGFDFQISGHTHAGQFYPFALIAKLYLKYFEGHYQINGKTQLYVNRGTGFWGPPNRLGKMSEITHFTLKKQPA